jgi:hypothetical protein
MNTATKVRDEAAVFLKPYTVVAFKSSAERLNQLCNARADYKLNESELEELLKEEIQAGNMLFADKPHRVVPTGETLGCLIEFKCWGDDRFFYCFAMRLEARRI